MTRATLPPGRFSRSHWRGEAGIRVADHQLVAVEGHGVAVIKRFDRLEEQRVPFVSVASLLALPVGDSGAYTLVADAIRQFGHDVAGDLQQLWRRMVFSLLASNFDDHLRNHSFLMHQAGRWSLSPAYNLNPVPEIKRARMNKTVITEDNEEPTITGAMNEAGRFAIKPCDAKVILREVVDAVSAWRQTGKRLKLKATTLEAYASAFEHDLMGEAKAVLK